MKNYTYVLTKRITLVFLALFAWSSSLALAAPLLPADAPTQIGFQTNGTGVDGKVMWVYSKSSFLVSEGTAKFVIEVSVNGGGWVSAGADVAYATTPQTDYILPVTGLVDGSTYKYRVKIISTLEESPFAESSTYTYTALTGSTSISEQNKTQGSITINIVDGVTGEDGYKIYIKKVGASSFTLNRTLTLSSPEQVVNILGLDANSFYQIYVQAYKGDNNKVSNTITVKTNRALPPQPTSFTYRDLCPEKVTVDFTFADISQFDELELKMNGVIIRTGLPGTGTFTITGLNPGVNYSFVILTRNETGIRNSEALNIRTPAYLAPDGPYNITDPYDITSSSMTVSWLNGQEDYPCLNKIRNEINLFVQIEKRDGTVENKIFATYKDATSYTITGLPMKAKVTITLSAYNDFHKLRGYGERQVSATTLGPPITPVDLGAKAQKDHLGLDEILVTWNEYANDEDGSIVEVKVGAGDYKIIGKIKPNIAIFYYKPTQAGVTYVFRVKAFNVYGDSDYSESATVTPGFTSEPNAPSNLNAVNKDGAAYLTWLDDSNNESGFEVQKSEDAGVTWVKIGETGMNVTMFTDASVVAGKTYWYGVRSVNSAGNSDLAKASFKIAAATDGGTVGVVNVYPNPTVDAINLRVDNAKQGTVSIYNQSNRRILSKSVDFQNGELTLDVSGFAPGAYQVVIFTGDQKISKKIYKY